MPTITCDIPEMLDARLTAAAEERGLPKSEVVRQALEKAVGGLGGSGEPTAYDLMKGACGIVKGGARDLATNPEHMKNFGRD